MSDTIVVDASVAVKWVLEEPYTTEALALRNKWASQEDLLLEPTLLIYEVANALYKRVVREQRTVLEANQALQVVLSIGIVLEAEAQISSRALELASEFRRPTPYDAHYLALAAREDCECWTADERLWNAVRPKLPWVHWIGEFQ